VLKCLEEPPPQTVFMLVTSNPDRLLPTIRSRCQAVPLPLPVRKLAESWLSDQGVEDAQSFLALAGGSPLLAASLLQSEPLRRKLIDQLRDPRFDPIVATDHCLGADPAEVVGWLQRWVYDLLSIKLTGVIRYHLAEGDSIRKLSAACGTASVCALLHNLARARGLAQHPLNTRLFFEDLLIQYRALVAAPGQ
jgi:DNA polymerase-3 subunit delta'